LGEKTLVEKDVEEQRGENTPLKHSPFDRNNKVARRGGVADNASVAEQHACYNFNRCNGKAGASEGKKEIIVSNCVERLGDVEREQMSRAATAICAIKMIGEQIAYILSAAARAKSKCMGAQHLFRPK
jgi:hypothetical protein